MSNEKAVLVDHTVEDFERWMPIFDDHASARRDASVVAEHLNRGIDDPNRVIIFMKYTSDQKMQAFLDSKDLRETMQEAGVVGPPDITFMIPVKEDVIWDRTLPAIIVRHPVEDYDAWREVYDEVDELRQEHGIVGDAVNRAGDDGNDIIVYHQAETQDALEQFVALPALERAMARGGVKGAPDITYVLGGIGAD